MRCVRDVYTRACVCAHGCVALTCRCTQTPATSMAALAWRECGANDEPMLAIAWGAQLQVRGGWVCMTAVSSHCVSAISTMINHTACAHHFTE
jgi:hypothetical protein